MDSDAALTEPSTITRTAGVTELTAEGAADDGRVQSAGTRPGWPRSSASCSRWPSAGWTTARRGPNSCARAASS